MIVKKQTITFVLAYTICIFWVLLRDTPLKFSVVILMLFFIIWAFCGIRIFNINNFGKYSTKNSLLFSLLLSLFVFLALFSFRNLDVSLITYLFNPVMLPSLLVFHFFYIGRSYCSLYYIINICMNISFLLMPISILFPKFIDLITPVLLYAAVVTADTSISTRKIVKFITVTLLIAALCFYHDSRIGMVIVLCSLLLFISIKARLIHFLRTSKIICSLNFDSF